MPPHFFLAVLLLRGEGFSWMWLTGVVLVVGGIVFVSGMFNAHHRAPPSQPLQLRLPPPYSRQ